MADDTNDKETNQDDADNFGLPELEYKPLNQLDTSKPKGEEPAATQEETYKSSSSQESTSETPTYVEEEEEGSKSGWLVMLIILLVIGVGGFFVWKYVYVPRKQKQELAAAKLVAEAKEKAKADSTARANEAERLRLENEAKNAKPAEGAIDTLSQRTGHYYVIISSAVDGDLVMDRAKKLSAAGTSSRIIKPFGKWKFYRLGIGDYDSFASAQSSADASKSEYGDALWVMKY